MESAGEETTDTFQAKRSGSDSSIGSSDKAKADSSALAKGGQGVSTSVDVPRLRGTTNRNARGGSDDRRRRKRFLLEKFGDGKSCPCWKCGCRLVFETITVDRIIPGCEGGTYRRDNIRPACATDNSKDGGKLGAERLRLKRLATQANHS